MEAAPRPDPPPPQRVCPHCARVAYATERRCPYCRRPYRRNTLLGVAALLLVFTVVILGAAYLMLDTATDRLEVQVDEEVTRIQEQFTQELTAAEKRSNQIATQGGANLPPDTTPTPTPTPEPEPTPAPTPAPTATPAPTP